MYMIMSLDTGCAWHNRSLTSPQFSRLVVQCPTRCVLLVQWGFLSISLDNILYPCSMYMFILTVLFCTQQTSTSTNHNPSRTTLLIAPSPATGLLGSHIRLLHHHIASRHPRNLYIDLHLHTLLHHHQPHVAGCRSTPHVPETGIRQAIRKPLQPLFHHCVHRHLV